MINKAIISFFLIFSLMIAQDTTPPTVVIVDSRANHTISISQTEATHSGGSSMHYQTFSPENNMRLDSIMVKHGYPHLQQSTTIKLKLFKGHGVSGTLLAEANNTNSGIGYSGGSGDKNDFYPYRFNGQNIALTANDVYTWQISFEGSQNVGWINFSKNDPYARGYGYYSSNIYTDDFVFKIHGEGGIADGDSSKDLSLLLAFVLSEASTDFTIDDIVMEGVGGGVISDFTSISSQLYAATYKPTKNGPQLIRIKDGSFTDAAGNANAAYSISQTKSGFGGGGSTHYQTFTATRTHDVVNYLDFIQVYHGFPHTSENRTIKLKLYKGSGVSGDLLGEANNSYTFSANAGSNFYPYFFSGQNISLTANDVYTWQISFEGSQNVGWISFAGDNPYPGGYGYYCCDDVTNDDFLFKIQGDDIFYWTHIVNTKPTTFKWVDSKKDTINITKENLATKYKFEWTKSTDQDGENLSYILHAKVGSSPWEEVNEYIDGTSIEPTYEQFLQAAFEAFPTVNAVTAAFTMDVTDGIDTVRMDDVPKVIYIRRYDYLSTIDETVPATFALHENYPNPFNPTTTFRFDLPEVSDVNVVIYNMLGQKVKTFNMNSISAGSHSIKWNATNELGDPVGAGVYLYQLQAKDFIKTRKMILLK